jgi:hypothetical protein
MCRGLRKHALSLFFNRQRASSFVPWPANPMPLANDEVGDMGRGLKNG